ncbi:MAG: hypothetical protein HZB79_03245 [Deltaproteobacteria bacterium]|nr:hypothetical protein [Deltaproteobacteria bacterium]
MSDTEIVEIKKKLEEHEKRILQLESLFNDKPETVKKKISVKEFIISKRPKGDIQKTLVIGYYLEKYEGFSSFNAKDLESCFGTAKESIPGNINYKVIKNIEKGYMAEAKEKKDNLKAWYLTNSGEGHVEDGFGSK